MVIHVFVKNVWKKGRGVFAGKNFKKDELIECCPVIILNPKEANVISKTVLEDYYFPWGHGDDKKSIVLGYGSVYNHSYKPNIEYIHDAKKKVVNFIALKAIKKGEELCSNYNGNWDDLDPVWFDKGKKGKPKIPA